MTDFNINIEVDYTVDSQYHNDGRADIHLTFDPESRKAFYDWLASGCTTELVITKKGCRAGNHYVTTDHTQTVPLPYTPSQTAPPPYAPSQTHILCNSTGERSIEFEEDYKQ